jgi:hypothetical protein
MSRRQALVTGGAGLAAATLGPAAAQDASPQASPVAPDSAENITYLFVQSFQSGSIAATEGKDGRYTVTLEQGLGQTIYFADRPSREVGVTPTPQFLDGLGFSEDNPPNAAMLVETAPGETDIAVVELFNPSYDEATQTATYEVQVLENWEDDLDLGLTTAPADLATLVPNFGTAHLLIDDCPSGGIACNDNRNGDINYFDPGGPYNFCYAWGQCMPCTPYSHSQPSNCATWDYWKTQCNQTSSVCASGDCTPYWGAGISNLLGCS